MGKPHTPAGEGPGDRDRTQDLARRGRRGRAFGARRAGADARGAPSDGGPGLDLFRHAGPVAGEGRDRAQAAKDRQALGADGQTRRPRGGERARIVLECRSRIFGSRRKADPRRAGRPGRLRRDRGGGRRRGVGASVRDAGPQDRRAAGGAGRRRGRTGDRSRRDRGGREPRADPRSRDGAGVGRRHGGLRDRARPVPRGSPALRHRQQGGSGLPAGGDRDGGPAARAAERGRPPL